MKSMRDMIKLMENVMAVPGMGRIGGSESDMQTAGTVGRNASYAEFDSAQQPATEGANDNERHYREGFTFGRAVKAGQHAKLNDAEAEKYSPAFMKGYKEALGMHEGTCSTEESGGNYGNFTVTTTTGKWTVYGPDDTAAMQSHLSGQHGGAGQRMYGEIIDMVPYTGPVEPSRDAKSNRSYVDENIPAVDYCKQTNPASADVACAMRENMSNLIYDQQYLRFSNLMSSFVEPQQAFDKISQEMTDQGIEGEEHDAIMQRLENDFFPDDSAFDMMNGPDDFSDDAGALASAGRGSDEDYGDFPMGEARGSDINPAEVKSLATMQVDAAKARAHEIIAASRTSDNRKSYLANQVNRARSAMDVTALMYNMILAGEGNAVQGSNYSKKFGNANTMEEAFDMQNGYNDVDEANGSDFFPNGATSPVVSKVGPSGARQGDNPQQKKMQVAEVHKELVYGYRNFLRESAKK